MFLSSLIIIIIILKFRENIFLVRPEWLLFVEVKQKKTPLLHALFIFGKSIYVLTKLGSHFEETASCLNRTECLRYHLH